jgi:L,D-transpeptidase ErfK/SrfK
MKIVVLCSLFFILSVGTSYAFSGSVIEEDITYKAVKGDYLEKIAGMNGVELTHLLRENPQTKKYIYPGDIFKVTRRTIVPEVVAAGIIVNIADRTLYHFKGGKLTAHYPVGVGKPSWRTPTGEFKVTGKQKDPTWHVPPSIQREMSEKGESVKTLVPPGPDNPLGHFEVRLSIPGVLIHATIWPESVYGYRSHGCIRLKPADAEEFYNSAEKGETGRIIYQPVKLALTEAGRVYIEVHMDKYGLAGDLDALVRKQIEDAGLKDKVDWDKVKGAVTNMDGIATDVTK